MSREPSIQRYRSWYAKLLRLYPAPYRERFGQGMEQTFGDLLRERAEEGRGLSHYALWMFVDTSAGIIRENMTSMFEKGSLAKRLSVWAIIVTAVLMIPLLAKFPWTGSDFVFGAVVLFGSALMYELLSRTSGNAAYRLAAGIAVASALLLVWINAAVGIIGDGPVNSMYLGVLAVGFVGALVAQLKPRGMARALFATAAAQMLVPIIALAILKPGQQEMLIDSNSPDSAFAPGVVPVFTLNAVFAMLFVGAALLFRRAAQEQDRN